MPPTALGGAPGPKTPSLGTATFHNVADLGNTRQPIVAFEVKAGQNVGQTTSVYAGGSDQLGAYLTNYTDQFVRDFAISPDGQKIVFELAPYTWGELSGGVSDLYMMGLGESTAHLFIAGAAHPSWSLRAPQIPPSTTQPTRLYLPLLVR